MNDAPERIGLIGDGMGRWALAHVNEAGQSVHYRRADLPPTDEQVMAHPKVKALVEALEELLMAFDEHIALPDANCSCHISPPCGDCENYSFAREAHTNARAALRDLKGGE